MTLFDGICFPEWHGFPRQSAFTDNCLQSGHWVRRCLLNVIKLMTHHSSGGWKTPHWLAAQFKTRMAGPVNDGFCFQPSDVVTRLLFGVWCVFFSWLPIAVQLGTGVFIYTAKLLLVDSYVALQVLNLFQFSMRFKVAIISMQMTRLINSQFFN